MIKDAIKNGSPLGKMIFIVGWLVVFTMLYFVFRNLDVKSMFEFVRNLRVK